METKIKNLEKARKKKCKCGHSHIAYCGELMSEGEGYYRINECVKCSCEDWEDN